jgi:uncharacterized protein (DUF1684 family)
MRFNFKLTFLVLIIFQNTVFSQNAKADWEDHIANYIKETKGRFTDSEQDFYEYSEKFNVLAHYKKPKKSKIISLPTSGTKIKDYQVYAVATFEVEGQKQQITIYRPLPVSPLNKNLLFVLFKDPSAPSETYGGGRYLDMNINDFKDGKVYIDFNRAYNPYCAFSDGWNCPIPPKENHLKLKITAGEKNPLNKH